MRNCLHRETGKNRSGSLVNQLFKPFLFLLLFITVTTYGQQKQVTGTVINRETNQPMSGVTVRVQGSNGGTQTDNNGRFTINAAPGNILLFSYVGYLEYQQRVDNQSTFSIPLQSNSGTNLAEVVVVGYGSQRKKDVTGSVATVTAKDFQKGVITTPEQLIAGKVAGVSIISNGGAPGAGSTIRIRGGSSLRASNDPLIVIDGVPTENSSISGAANALSFINPNDIESFTVLKDASSAAIYGTRASNGVIIITTKKGTGGRFRVNVNSVNSISKLIKEVDILSADQFRAIVNTNGTTAQKAMLGTSNTNWQDEIYQTAFTSDNTISLSGGIKKFPYRLSVGYLTQQGILRTGYLHRTSAALAINPVLLNGHLKVDLNLKGSMQDSRFANQGAIGAAVSFDPTQPVMVKSPRFGGYFEWLDPTSSTGLQNLGGRNPVGLLEQRVDKSTPVRSIGNIQLDYKFHFLPELHANLNVGYDASTGKGTIFVSDSAASDYLVGGTGGQNNTYKQTKFNSLVEFYLNYVKNLSSIKSRIDVLGGYAYNNFQTTIYNYASYTAKGVKYPNSDPTFPFNKPENTLVSFFGRLNYSYNDKYFLTTTLRRDGSSRFSDENRWGVFPSVSLAWSLKEQFFKSNTSMPELKLRLGYGVTGQQDGIGNYNYLSSYSTSTPTASYQFGNEFYQMYRPGGYNPNIKWEQTATKNIALDFGFLQNRINGSIEVYHKETTDLLNSIPQPAGTNFSAFITSNVGDMTNKGIEFSINTQPVRKADFTWDLSYNITYNKNEITNLTVVPQDKNYVGFPSGGIAGGIGGQFSQINSVGFAKNTFYLYKQVYNANGMPVEGVFVDQNGDGIINQNDLYKSKQADPNVFMGLSTSVNYKNWNAGVVMRANLNNYVYNNTYSATGTRNQVLGNSVLYNASSNYLESRFIGNSLELLSDYYIQNASFLRMDNLNVGYNAGKVLRNKATLRLNASIQNVFVITKYKGIDPEIGSGIDNNFYPRPRTYSLGINLDF